MKRLANIVTMGAKFASPVEHSSEDQFTQVRFIKYGALGIPIVNDKAL